MADDRLITIPIMESKAKEIKKWCKKNTPGYVMRVVPRPYEYKRLTPNFDKLSAYTGYDFYLFAFNTAEELCLFKLVYSLEQSEWKFD